MIDSPLPLPGLVFCPFAYFITTKLKNIDFRALKWGFLPIFFKLFPGFLVQNAVGTDQR